ncbi:Protein CLT2 chloroplastic [Zea mays]|uniref:Protein CLT2 chloroplastic n=1 Tax=Zea mays TaxID=4577 RepID=A0A1D6PI87_MAIZE|nr:Protein CLT2 chloroplastic [Zea mays]
MPVPPLLSPLRLPSPAPPLHRNGAPWRRPTQLRAALRVPPPLHLGLAAARGDGVRRFVGTLGSKRARAVGAIRVSAISGDGGGGAGGTGIAAAAAATVVFAVMNRVLYKLALVPMKNYPFFLAQFATFGYVLVYFSILFIRFRAGIVTREMLALPKPQFMLIGLLEALGAASGMAAAAMLPGPSIPVLSQEFVFIDGAKRLEGKKPDIFVVNSFGSGFQALFIFLLLPFLSNLKGIPFAELPAYLTRGAACFLNVGGNLKVPLSIYILSLPLPYLPEGTNLSASFLIGVATLVLGLLLYNLPQESTNQVKED